MKKLLLASLALFFQITLQAQITFQKKISNLSSSHAAMAAEQTSDGGYLIAGAGLVPFSTGNALVSKLSPQGNIIWSRIFNSLNDGAAYDVLETYDGGIISTGYYYSGASSNIFLYKSFSTGGLDWLAEYGGTAGRETGLSLQQLSDSGFVIGGFTLSLSGNNEDIYLVRTNSMGFLDWNKTYSSNEDERATSVELTSDGGFIITGFTEGFGATGQDVILIKTDSAGNIDWAKRFDSSLDESGNSVHQTADGGYIVAGNIQFAGSDDAFLMKTDSTGNITWTKKYHYIANNYANKVLITSDGGYIIAGSCNPSGLSGSKFLTIKTDPSGNVMWSKTYGGASGDVANDIVQTNDGGYFMTGIGDLYANILIVKTDTSGNSGCNDSTITISESTTSLTGTSIFPTDSTIGTSFTFTVGFNNGGTVTTTCLSTGISENELKEISFNLYPNPATDHIMIGGLDANEKTQITLLNSMGQVVFEKSCNCSSENIDFDFTTGVYSVIVSNEFNRTIKRFMVVR